MANEALGKRPHPAAVPSSRLLLHPVALVALAVLVVNDHILKAAIPGLVTGKLSDVAGLVVFPLLLVTLVHALRPTANRSRVGVVVIVATAIGFMVVKTTPLGSAAFSWGLGAMQWVATLGPIRGGTLAPVVNVVDPTDLIALPALLVAGWIAGVMTSVPRWVAPGARASAMSQVVLIVAGLATMATSQGAPSAGAEFETELHLTKDAPMAVRHLDFTIAKGADSIESVTFTSSLWERVKEGSNEFMETSDARLSLIADESDVEIPIEQGFLSPALDLTALCVAGCDHGVTLVARLAPDANDTDVVLNAGVYASGAYREGEDQSMDTAISLVEDVEARFDGTAPSILKIASGSIEVASDVLEQRQTIELAVDGSALKGPLGFPLVGQLSVSFVVESASDNPSAAQITVSTREAADPIYLEAEGVPLDIDWLRRCKAGTDCLVPIDITVMYDPAMNAPVPEDPESEAEPTESAPGFVRLDWTVEARLEAFDGRSLPMDALTLETD